MIAEPLEAVRLQHLPRVFTFLGFRISALVDCPLVLLFLSSVYVVALACHPKEGDDVPDWNQLRLSPIHELYGH